MESDHRHIHRVGGGYKLKFMVEPHSPRPAFNLALTPSPCYSSRWYPLDLPDSRLFFNSLRA